MLIKPLPLLNFFVAMVMFTIGLRVSGGELLGIVRDRGLLLRSLLANCVIIPTLGVLLVLLFPLTPDVTVGILLLAAVPGTPIALQFTRQAKTRLAFAAAMTFVLSVVSLAMAPLAVELMPKVSTHSQRPLVHLLASIVLYIGLPLGAGLWVARHAPKIAPRLVLPLGILATVIFVFLMWETRLARREAFNAIRGRGTILAMLILLFSGMLIGWRIGGPDPDSRRIMATATSMRSVIVVLYIARYCFPGTNVYMVPIVYLSLMVPTNMLFHLAFTVWQKLKLRRMAAPA